VSVPASSLRGRALPCVFVGTIDRNIMNGSRKMRFKRLLEMIMQEQGEQTRRLMAVFRRQVWVNDVAMDTEEPIEFDATVRLLRLPLLNIQHFRENDYDSDYLSEDLPERIEWTGPFEVDVDIDEWLERNGVLNGRNSLTQEDLERLRQEYGVY
jgi:hypothetical protein